MSMERLERYKRIAQFGAARLSDYVELGSAELSLFRSALIATVTAYVVMAFCAIFALVFLSVAILVSFWTTDYRVTAAWCIFGVWMLLALGAFLTARSKTPDTMPQSVLGEQIRLDLDAIRGRHEHHASPTQEG